VGGVYGYVIATQVKIKQKPEPLGVWVTHLLFVLNTVALYYHFMTRVKTLGVSKRKRCNAFMRGKINA
jgi:hypothetical protein